jgi:hypothetical protein
VAEGVGESVWWWKHIWKLKCSLKARIFMWLALKNKALAWDVLQKKGKQGHGWCSLYKTSPESIVHLLMFCPFTGQVWKELEACRLRDIWGRKFH